MAKRLQHDMTTDPHYTPWIVGAFVILAAVGLMYWGLSENSDTATDKTGGQPASQTTGSAPGSPKAPVK